MRRLLLVLLLVLTSACLPAYQGPTTGVKVIVIGDSLTYQSTDELTPMLVEGQYRYVVSGISGATMGSRMADIDEAFARKPDHLVIALGTNDVFSPTLCWCPEDIANLERILTTLPVDVPVTWIIPPAGGGRIVTGIEKYASLGYPRVTAARWDLLVAEHRSEWVIVGDGIHYTAAGQQAYAEFIAGQVE